MKKESGDERQVLGGVIVEGSARVRDRLEISFVHREPEAWTRTGSRVMEEGSEEQE